MRTWRCISCTAAFILLALTPPPSLAAPSGPALAREVARLAAPRAGSLALDPSLEKAALRHAREVLAHENAARLERVTAALEAEGLADAQVLPFAAVGEDPEALARLLRAFAEETARDRGMTHVGIAFAGDPLHPRSALAAIFSRRVVELSPLPHEARGSRFVVRGRAREADRIEALLLRPCKHPSAACDGEVVTLPVQLAKNALTVIVPFDRGTGRYTLELLATRDRGPEVAALWTFASDAKTHATETPRPLSSTNDDRALESRVAEAREVRELAPLPREEHLDRAALAHAENVCRTMIAAHVLESGSDPLARAHAAGFEGRVSENVAIASSVDRAHENLLATPSHRRNVLDPAARAIGIGVARSGDHVCVVELFAL